MKFRPPLIHVSVFLLPTGRRNCNGIGILVSPSGVLKTMMMFFPRMVEIEWIWIYFGNTRIRVVDLAAEMFIPLEVQNWKQDKRRVFSWKERWPFRYDTSYSSYRPCRVNPRPSFILPLDLVKLYCTYSAGHLTAWGIGSLVDTILCLRNSPE